MSLAGTDSAVTDDKFANGAASTAFWFAAGFVPGVDLGRALLDPSATKFDVALGALAVIPGGGKVASLAGKGFRAIFGFGKRLFRRKSSAAVTRGGSTSLFRAVSKAELDDVAQFGFRPKPGGGSLETKLFATSADDAAAFGRDLFRLDRQPFTILETRIPNSLRGRLDNLILDGRSAVGVNPDLLPALNAAGRTSPLPFSPIP